MDREECDSGKRELAFGGVTLWLALWVLIFSVSLPRATGSTYYVSPDGDDDATGRSPGTPWRSLAKVSSSIFRPGDSILFKRGGIFEGTLCFEQDDSGSAGRPVKVGAYGDELAKRPILRPGRRRGVDLYNVSWFRIRDLIVEGAGAEINIDDGILLLSSRSSGGENVIIENVEVMGFGDSGISIGVWQTERGFSDVRIAGSSFHDNRKAGVHTWGKWGRGIYSHRNVHIVDSIAYNMKGGSGLILSSVDGGVVERCIAHSNGEQVSGAAGIWAWDSNDILVQYNESYGNRTTRVDGDGFDFDGGVTNSVMQYNYSHDNDAAGFLLAQYAYAPQAMDNIVIRHNVSRNDCRKKDYGAIHVWKARDEDEIRNVHISQNVVYLSGEQREQEVVSDVKDEEVAAGWERGGSAIAIVSQVASVFVEKNVFHTTGGRFLVSVVEGQKDMLFRSNVYWSGADPFLVRWMGTSHTSLDEWLSFAPGQERLNSRIVAIQSDPSLAKLGSASGSLGFVRESETFRVGKDSLEKGHDLAEAAKRLHALEDEVTVQNADGSKPAEATPAMAESF